MDDILNKLDIEEEQIFREIRSSRGSVIVRQLVEQLNALQLVKERLVGTKKVVNTTKNK
jgi:hypothetical protein